MDNPLIALPELDRQVAEKMGWEFVESDYLTLQKEPGLVQCADPRLWGTPSYVKHEALFEELDINAVGFYFVDTANKKIIPREDFRPSIDARAAFKALAWLHAKNYGLELTTYPDGKCEWWLLEKYSSDYYEHSLDGITQDSTELAICAAVLAAQPKE